MATQTILPTHTAVVAERGRALRRLAVAVMAFGGGLLAAAAFLPVTAGGVEISLFAMTAGASLLLTGAVLVLAVRSRADQPAVTRYVPTRPAPSRPAASRPFATQDPVLREARTGIAVMEEWLKLQSR